VDAEAARLLSTGVLERNVSLPVAASTLKAPIELPVRSAA
jgi:hypothetical protein